MTIAVNLVIISIESGLQALSETTITLPQMTW